MTRHEAPRSLKSRALQLLAQREQSRVELRRKLLAYAVADASVGAPEAEASVDARRAQASDGSSGSAPGPLAAQEFADARDLAVEAGVDAMAAAARQVDELLAWLESHGFVSDERFVESRVNARVGRYGNLRIRHELKQHGLVLDADAGERLRDSEGARAWTVWERRFGSRPATPADMARQARFLSARGFSADTVSRVMRRARTLPAEQEASAEGD